MNKYTTKTGRPLMLLSGEGEKVSPHQASVLECHYNILRIYKKIHIGWFFLEIVYCYVNEDTAAGVLKKLIDNHLPPLVIRKSFILKFGSWTIWEKAEFL